MTLTPIPSFLVRSKDNVTRPRPGRKAIRWVMPKLPHSKRPPKSKTFKGAEKVTIHLADECKTIGSGVRIVWCKVGRTCVYLCDPLGNRGKLRLDTFRGLVVKEAK